MSQNGTAYFVYSPRTISDLIHPHDLKDEKPYRVVHTVSLSAMSYENFISDMLADRQFLEDYADLCRDGVIWQCVLVKQRGSAEGVLVIPDGCYVKYAAFMR